MFNKIKKEFGSIAKDQDLLDHLDSEELFRDGDRWSGLIESPLQ